MITLAEAKHHLRVDFDDDDADIGQMIAAGVDHLASVGVDVETEPMPPAVKRAALLLIGHFYAHRGEEPAKADDPRSASVDRLITPYREIVL